MMEVTMFYRLFLTVFVVCLLFSSSVFAEEKKDDDGQVLEFVCPDGKTECTLELEVVPPELPAADEKDGGSSWLTYTLVGGAIGALGVGGTAYLVDPPNHTQASWDDGSGLSGALIGAGLGALVGLIVSATGDDDEDDE